MSRFYYEAVDLNGRKVPGLLDCESERRLQEILEEKGQTLVAVSSRPIGGATTTRKRLKRGRVKAAERAAFAQQMSRLMETGCPMDRALDMTQGTAQSQAMASALESIRMDVKEGRSLEQSLGEHTEIFPALFISTVRAGEAGGFLAKAFERLSTFEKNQDRLNRKIVSSLVYPVFMIGTLLGSLGVIFTFVVPSLVTFFAKSEMVLPAPTRILIRLSRDGPELFTVFAGIAALLLFVRYQFGNTPAARDREDRILLKIPVVGGLIQTINLARFCRTMSLLLDGGVVLTKALSITRDAITNRVFRKEIEVVVEQVTGGEPLSRCLEVSPVFPDILSGQVRLGEETGSHSRVLESLAEDFEQQSEGALETLVSLVEPTMIVVMGGVMGFVVIALFMPLVEMSNIK